MIIIKIGAGVVVVVILLAGFIEWYGNMRETRGYGRGIWLLPTQCIFTNKKADLQETGIIQKGQQWHIT